MAGGTTESTHILCHRFNDDCGCFQAKNRKQVQGERNSSHGADHKHSAGSLFIVRSLFCALLCALGALLV